MYIGENELIVRIEKTNCIEKKTTDCTIVVFLLDLLTDRQIDVASATFLAFS